MKIEIWSDVACPWCYIGKRRFEAAFAQFPHRDEVEVVWRSFQLDPHAPRHSEKSVTDILAAKYGVSRAQAAAMNERVSGLAAQEGLEYHMDEMRYANTFDAHRLIHLAAAHGKQQEAEERFFKAYFTEGKDLGDAETLVQLATEIGVDGDEARAVLAGDTYADAVRADVQRAAEFGIQGVPFFAIDETYGISGAQPSDLFGEVLERAWSDAHPRLQMVSASQDDAGTCDDESCAI
ncbi:MAG: DsbA family oxidoreductase [Ktedonobacterales bacterium]